MDLTDQASLIPVHLRNFDCSANEVIRFKIIRSEKDLENDQIDFSPELTHQIFGESERIFGYKNLEIDIYCLASSLNFYININYEEKLNQKKNQQFKADNIEEIIEDWIPSDTTTNLDNFIRQLNEQSKSLPFGEQIFSQHLKQDKSNKTYSIYRYNEMINENPSFHQWYSRLETFLVFFIDAASSIDKTDPNWIIYLLYEEYKDDFDRQCFTPIGFVSVYLYYSYPDKKRARISQILILPPYQRQGHGRTLLKRIYQDLIDNDQIRDITAEDPSDEFICLRDLVTFELVQKSLPEIFSKKSIVENKYLTKEIIEKSQKICKLTKKETRRIHEISLLNGLNQHDQEQMKFFRLLVKKRLFEPLQFDNRRRLQLSDPSLESISTDPEKRKVFLSNQYEFVVEHYRKLIKSFERNQDRS